MLLLFLFQKCFETIFLKKVVLLNNFYKAPEIKKHSVIKCSQVVKTLLLKKLLNFKIIIFERYLIVVT